MHVILFILPQHYRKLTKIDFYVCSTAMLKSSVHILRSLCLYPSHTTRRDVDIALDGVNERSKQTSCRRKKMSLKTKTLKKLSDISFTNVHILSCGNWCSSNDRLSIWLRDWHRLLPRLYTRLVYIYGGRKIKPTSVFVINASNVDRFFRSSFAGTYVR